MQTSLTGDEFATWRDYDWVQYPDIFDAGGEMVDVAHVAAVTLANVNLSDGALAAHDDPRSRKMSVFDELPGLPARADVVSLVRPAFRAR